MKEILGGVVKTTGPTVIELFESENVLECRKLAI